jgi:hypothetical protein
MKKRLTEMRTIGSQDSSVGGVAISLFGEQGFGACAILVRPPFGIMLNGHWRATTGLAGATSQAMGKNQPFQTRRMPVQGRCPIHGLGHAKIRDTFRQAEKLAFAP